MKGLARAILVFFVGSAAVLLLALGLKLALVRVAGERVYRLPSLQMERLRDALPRKPVSDARVLVIGDSTATFSVDASKIKFGESFAVVNTTTIETYYLLKRILESGTNPHCILAAYSFQWELNREFFWSMFVSEGFYGEAELAEIDGVRRSFGEGEARPVQALKNLAVKAGWLDLVTMKRLQEVFFYWGWGKESVVTSRQLLRHRRGSTVLRDASNFEGSLDMFFGKAPSVTRTELEYLRRTLALAQSKGIPFIVLKIPFAETIPAEKAQPYWEAYEEIFNAAGAPFRVLGAPPMPESHYLSAGHLNQKGVDAMSLHLERSLEMCYR